MVTLDTSHKYAVFIDGNPAAPDLPWSAEPNLIAIATAGDGRVMAHPIGVTPDEAISTSIGARSGTVHVELVAAPLVITFGPAEPA